MNFPAAVSFSALPPSVGITLPTRGRFGICAQTDASARQNTSQMAQMWRYGLMSLPGCRRLSGELPDGSVDHSERTEIRFMLPK